MTLEQMSKEVHLTPNSSVERFATALREPLKNEPAYLGFISVSENKGYTAIKAKHLLVAKIAERKNGVTLEFKSAFDDRFSSYQITHLNDGFSRVTFESINEICLLSDTLAYMAVELLVSQGGESFGCCSRFEECSDAKACTNPDPFFSMACSYRKNLEQGRIFYGKNKNI